jgi:coproporphyrinogen III oxidase
MNRIPAQSATASTASKIIEGIQQFFVERLNRLSADYGEGLAFQPVEWFRDEGRHGGGVRYVAADESLFNRASVNYSQVHYDDTPDKRLASATAISTIIHPRNPYAPSMHMHISWTEMRDGSGYWRVMGDLNPSLPDEAARQRFLDTFKAVSGSYYDEGVRQGDRYFFIPALNRHRGVAHFYLEQFSTGSAQDDMAFAKQFGEAVITTYIDIVSGALERNETVSETDRASQLAYHTTYLLQVLTLDRGTTSGLLVHDQNDVGIMGSIPSHVDAGLLTAWKSQLPELQQPLLQMIIDVLEGKGVVLVDDSVKSRLARAVRTFYRAHPEALAYQASGNVIPDTVNNHHAGKKS